MTISKSLDKAILRAKRISFDLTQDRYVIMSDQHMGDGKRGSDDFRRNKECYVAALRHYFEQGYRLICLGDTEELWECDFEDVQQAYQDVYETERLFFDDSRLIRIFGNHDIFWRNNDYLRRYLHPVFPGIENHEAVLLEAEDGRIFLTHGHQGELFSHRLWRISRLIVRRIWKPIQRLLRIPSSGAADNIKKRNRKEVMYYNWAKERGVVFIAGHTHRAMFESLSELDRLRMRLSHLLEAQPPTPPSSTSSSRRVTEEIVKTEEKIYRVSAQQFKESPEPLFEPEAETSPCYFNDGCCSYTTGITAIEIDMGTIRLVKWDRKTLRRTIYEEADLAFIFSKIRTS